MQDLASLSDEQSLLLPLRFGDNDIFILDKDSKVLPENDRGLFKAVINGYNVDTRQFVEADGSRASGDIEETK